MILQDNSKLYTKPKAEGLGYKPHLNRALVLRKNEFLDRVYLPANIYSGQFRSFNYNKPFNRFNYKFIQGCFKKINRPFTTLKSSISCLLKIVAIRQQNNKWHYELEPALDDKGFSTNLFDLLYNSKQFIDEIKLIDKYKLASIVLHISNNRKPEGGEMLPPLLVNLGIQPITPDHMLRINRCIKFEMCRPNARDIKFDLLTADAPTDFRKWRYANNKIDNAIYLNIADLDCAKLNQNIDKVYLGTIDVDFLLNFKMYDYSTKVFDILNSAKNKELPHIGKPQNDVNTGSQANVVISNCKPVLNLNNNDSTKESARLIEEDKKDPKPDERQGNEKQQNIHVAIDIKK